jgi:Phage tail tube protein
MATAPAVTTAITGKKITVKYGTDDGTAQITSASISEQSSSNTIQTLGGSVVVGQGVETSVSADFLYDGDIVGGGFYAALKAALKAQSQADVTIAGKNGEEWVGKALVLSLSVEIPADDAVTCSAELGISGELAFTPAAAVVNP